MSLGKVWNKFRKTWIMFGLSLDELSNQIQTYIVNSNKREILEVII